MTMTSSEQRRAVAMDNILFPANAFSAGESRHSSKNAGSVAPDDLTVIREELRKLQHEIKVIEDQTAMPQEVQKAAVAGYNKSTVDDRILKITWNKPPSNTHNNMASDIIKHATALTVVLKKIWFEIRKWQNDQKKVDAGLLLKSSTTRLDDLDKACEEGGQLINRVMLQTKNVSDMYRRSLSRNDNDVTSKLVAVYNELKREYFPFHLKCGFIVEVHVPDGILCSEDGKSNCFQVTLRILGGRAFGLGYIQPSVKMSLVNKNCDGVLLKGNSCHDGVLRNSTFSVDACGRCRAQFEGVHVHLTNRGSDETIRRKLDKFALRFETTVRVHGCEITLKTVSPSVIITDCTADDVIARGILVWEAAFPEMRDRRCVSRETVLWSEFVTLVLNPLFVINTGRSLDQLQLNYLASFLFHERGNTDVSNRDCKEKHVIWDNLRHREFSFWTWIWANLCVIKDIVQKEWNAGLIYGFISKEDAQSKLLDSPRGTFLLRFSESDIEWDDSRNCYDDTTSLCGRRADVYGHLTIAFIQRDSTNRKQDKLYYIKDNLSPGYVEENGLFEILNALKVADETDRSTKRPLLKYLWPDTRTNFGEHFRQFCRPVNTTSSTGVEPSEDENSYKDSKLTIEIFLNEDARIKTKKPVTTRSQRQTSVRTMSALNSSTPGVCSANSYPEYALCLDVDPATPIAVVRPQIVGVRRSTSRLQRY